VKVALTSTTNTTKWFVKDLNTSTDVLSNQTIYQGVDMLTGNTVGTNLSTADGLAFSIDGSIVTGKWLTKAYLNGDGAAIETKPAASNYEYTNANYDLLAGYWAGTNGGTSNGFLNFAGKGSTDPLLLQNDIEFRWTGVREVRVINGKNVEVVASGGQMATLWTATNYALKDHPLNPNPGTNAPFLIRIPFEVWDVENNVQINFLVRHREGALTDNPFQVFNLTGRMYCDVLYTPYSATTVYDPSTTSTDLTWQKYLTWGFTFWGCHYTLNDKLRFHIDNPLTTADKFTLTAPGVTTDDNLAKADVNNVNVFPNPYYGANPQEINKYQRFVTFTHLPARATIKLFNIAGQLVRTLTKDATGQFLRWDLSTDSGLPVPSGIYVAYIDMPDQGVVKKLKVAIIQEQQFLDRF